MARPSRTLAPALVAAVTVSIALTGCVPADPLGAAARETTRTILSLDDDAREAAVIEIAQRAESDAWRAWGIDEELVSRALVPQSAWVLDERESPTGVQLASFAASASDIGSAFGIGFIAIGSLGKTAVEQSNDGTRGTGSTEIPGGSATVSVGADDVVTTTYTSGGSEGDLTVAITASSEIETCPDADGVVELSADVAVRVGVGSAGGSIELEVDATGRLDDNAGLASSDYSYRQQHSVTTGGKGQFLDHNGNSAGEVSVNRWSHDATAEFAKSAAEMAAALAAIVSHDLLANAEEGWTSGRCVDVTLSPSEDPGSLEPEADITIEAVAHSVHDGTETGGTLVATLTGEGALRAAGDRISAPATLDYSAPSEKGQSGTVSVESRSIRGIGRSSITLATGGGAYIASATVDEYSATGTICSLTEPFEIAGSGLTFSFTPSNKYRGEFRMTGARYDITFAADGRYSVDRDADGVATSLHANGDGTLITSDGISADSPVDITYSLTPTDPCE